MYILSVYILRVSTSYVHFKCIPHQFAILFKLSWGCIKSDVILSIAKVKVVTLRNGERRVLKNDLGTFGDLSSCHLLHGKFQAVVNLKIKWKTKMFLSVCRRKAEYIQKHLNSARNKDKCKKTKARLKFLEGYIVKTIIF